MFQMGPWYQSAWLKPVIQMYIYMWKYLFYDLPRMLRERQWTWKLRLKAYCCLWYITKTEHTPLDVICRDKDWRATHFLPIVKCTLHLLSHTKRSSIYFQASEESTQLIGRRRKGWLTSWSDVYFMLSLCCLPEWLKGGAQHHLLKE